MMLSFQSKLNYTLGNVCQDNDDLGGGGGVGRAMVRTGAWIMARVKVTLCVSVVTGIRTSPASLGVGWGGVGWGEVWGRG